MGKHDINQYKNIWVFAEQRHGKLMPVVTELVGEGRKLAEERGVELNAVLLGENLEEMTKELIAHGVKNVYTADHELLKNYTTYGYTKVISEAIHQHKPEIMLIGATHIGRDLAPRIASRVDTGLTADCTKLEIDPEDGKIKQTRPAFGGNIMATIVCPENRPQMSTVRPGVMQKMTADHSRTGETVIFDAKLEAADMNVEILEYVKETKAKANIEEAGMLISAGRGVGGKDNLGPLYDLADTIGGLVSGSRAVIDAGWLDKDRQVGQTGKTVRPEVYMACGISGAIQHVAGMEESELIIAVNKNPDAAIFEVADLGLVGDVAKILPLVSDLIKKVKKESNEK